MANCLPERDALVEVLESCPKLQSKEGRQDVIRDLSEAISSRIADRDDRKTHVLSIVIACIAVRNGIDDLEERLKFYEGEWKDWPKVEQAAERLRAKLAEEEARAAPPDESIASSASKLDRIALVIGISQYMHGVAPNQELGAEQFTNLKFAAADARDVHDFLSKQDGTLVVGALFDAEATFSRILHELDQLRIQYKQYRAAGSDPAVVVYFSGHGAQDAEGRSYLVPYDARRDHLFATTLWSRHLSAVLDEIGTKRLAVFLDACHGGAIGAEYSKGAEIVRFDPKSLNIPAVDQERYIIASCMAGQKSFEDKDRKQGIFTGHLLELLRCEEPDELPEEIDLWDLYAVLKHKVAQTAQKARFDQEPFASFDCSTGIILAINEPLRKKNRQLKENYLRDIESMLSPKPGKQPRVPCVRPRLLVNMLTQYIESGRQELGLDKFYADFDELWKPNDDSMVEKYCVLLVKDFEAAHPLKRSQSPISRSAIDAPERPKPPVVRSPADSFG